MSISFSAELPGGWPSEHWLSRVTVSLPGCGMLMTHTGGKNTRFSITVVINLHQKRNRDDRKVEKKKKEPILTPSANNNPVTTEACSLSCQINSLKLLHSMTNIRNSVRNKDIELSGTCQLNVIRGSIRTHLLRVYF